MTIVEGFSIFGSIVSALAIGVAIGIFFFQRNAEIKDKEVDIKLKIDAMNRLLAHRTIPLCHKIKLLCEIYIAITNIKYNKVYFYSKGNIKEIRLANLKKECNEMEYLSFKLPRDYQKLGDDVLLNCALLADRNNELLTTVIRINNGTEGIETILENACIYAESGSLEQFYQVFLSQVNGKSSLLSFMEEILNHLKVLEPEISTYLMYKWTCDTFNVLKKQ